MRDRFGHGQESMHVVCFRKHLPRNVPRSCARLRHQTNDLGLTLANRSKVSVEEFFEVVYRITVSALDERRRKRPQASETDEILSQRWKAS